MRVALLYQLSVSRDGPSGCAVKGKGESLGNARGQNHSRTWIFIKLVACHLQTNITVIKGMDGSLRLRLQGGLPQIRHRGQGTHSQNREKRRLKGKEDWDIPLSIRWLRFTTNVRESKTERAELSGYRLARLRLIALASRLWIAFSG